MTHEAPVFEARENGTDADDAEDNSTGAESPSGTAEESPGFDLVAGLIALIGAGALLAVRVRRPE